MQLQHGLQCSQRRSSLFSLHPSHSCPHRFLLLLLLPPLTPSPPTTPAEKKSQRKRKNGKENIQKQGTTLRFGRIFRPNCPSIPPPHPLPSPHPHPPARAYARAHLLLGTQESGHKSSFFSFLNGEAVWNRGKATDKM